jgi:hypothetical protein
LQLEATGGLGSGMITTFSYRKNFAEVRPHPSEIMGWGWQHDYGSYDATNSALWAQWGMQPAMASLQPATVPGSRTPLRAAAASFVPQTGDISL